MSSMETTVRRFIQENFLFGREPDFSDDASFLEQGIIDSTGVLELVGFLESQYQIHVADEELVPENLDSVRNLVGFIERKTEGAVVSQG